ncbi:MAG TPA: UDP-N-acetylmuramoyl-L-alanyl-D-glutamate--2,6-diaminopimelate ligase [Candidatus Paceibacterota bacterium]
MKTDYIERMKSLLRKFAPKFLMSWYHLSWAVLGAILYGFPARKMIVIGVTGTDGKSTTTETITRIFKEAGLKTCSTSSVWFQIGDRKWKNKLKMGMPGRMFLQKFLRQALSEGCTHAVIEVSSEGILQNRHRFLNFHTAVITNLSPEHIERHGSFEKYRAEKQKLFRVTQKVHVVNIDDENGQYFLQIPAKQTYAYGLQKAPSLPNVTRYLSAENIIERRDGTSFQVNGKEFQLKLIGKFNTYNALSAICVGLAHKISMETCKDALVKMERMPGRTDPVIEKPFVVLVDYAVTPKALENLYGGVRRLFEPKKLICVFGACGGGRDKWKRPILGKIASSYCDTIILTNEDPYDEDPNQILFEVESGLSRAESRDKTKDFNVHKILDRREAIHKALAIAQEGDVVVVSGKGSEDAIAVAGGKKIPWDERKVIEEEFAKLYKKA